MIKITVNGTSRNVDAEPDTPLLWVLREWLGMTGTKFGCGIAQCGACTVHLDGVARAPASCRSVRSAKRRSPPSRACRPTALSHPVQHAWLQQDVPQCGYCQSGQIMAAAALLKDEPEADRRRHRRRHDQHLPLRHLSAHPRGDPSRRLIGSKA